MALQNCKFCNLKDNLLSNNFICSSCGKLNPLPKNLDYFTYLDLPKIFPVNQTLLENKYLKLASVFHSDRFIEADEEQQLNSVAHISFLNEAYLTLKNEQKAIAALYEILTGYKIVAENTTLKDANFNQYIFSLNEELDEITAPPEKQKFITKIEALYAETKNAIIEEFKANHHSKIKELYVKLSYINRIKEKL